MFRLPYKENVGMGANLLRQEDKLYRRCQANILQATLQAQDQYSVQERLYMEPACNPRHSPANYPLRNYGLRTEFQREEYQLDIQPDTLQHSTQSLLSVLLLQ